MVTISRVVEKIVERSPFIQESLSRGIVNYIALAEDIKKEVEREMRQEVKESAIMMALRRLNEKLEKSFVKGIKFDRHSEITIQSNLINLVYKRTWEAQKRLMKVYELVSNNKPGEFLTVTQGPHEIDILTTDLYENKIEKIFEGCQLLKKIKNLAGITIKIPESFMDTPGFVYTISRTLLWNNINIFDTVSTFTELMLVVDEKDTSRTFEALRTLIAANQ